LSQTRNWTIDLIVQRIGAYDLNHSFDVTIGASSSHENMDMRTDMNMPMEDNNASRVGTTNNIAQEAGSESSPQPAFDSFAWLAVGLSIAVGLGSAYYFKKSKQQLKDTIRTLEG
jgi:hypothetical protein